MANSAHIEIAMAHRVMPEKPDASDPYAPITISVKELDDFLNQKKEYEFISLDQLNECKDPDKKYLALTFDDGYRDNINYALPVLEKHNMPATIFVGTLFADQSLEPFEILLHRLLNQAGLKNESFEKAYHAECAKFRCLPLNQRYERLKTLANQYGVDTPKTVSGDFMNWDEIKELSRHPLITIGSHGSTHRMLGKAYPWEAFYELKTSRKIIEEKLGKPVALVSYPYGHTNILINMMAKLVGYKRAFTTRSSIVRKPDSFALPRIDLNGEEYNYG